MWFTYFGEGSQVAALVSTLDVQVPVTGGGTVPRKALAFAPGGTVTFTDAAGVPVTFYLWESGAWSSTPVTAVPVGDTTGVPVKARAQDVDEVYDPAGNVFYPKERPASTGGGGGGGGPVAWGDVTGKPVTFPPDDHTHAQYATASSVSAALASLQAQIPTTPDDVGIDLSSAAAGMVLTVNDTGGVEAVDLLTALRDLGVRPLIPVETGSTVPPPGSAGDQFYAVLEATSTAFGLGNYLGGNGGASATAVTFTVAAATAVGDEVVVSVGADAAGGTANAFTVTDSKGNTWAQRRAPYAQGATSQVAVYGCHVAAGKAHVAGTDTITVTANAAKNHLVAHALSVQGVAASTPVDTSNNGGSTTVASSLTVTLPTTSQADVFVVAPFVFNASGKTFTPGSGTTQVGPIVTSTTGASQRGLAVLVQKLTAIQSLNVSAGLSPAESYAAAVVGLKKA